MAVLSTATVLSLMMALLLSEGLLRWLEVGDPGAIVQVLGREEGREQSKWDQGAYIPGGKLQYFYPDNRRGYFDETPNPPQATKDFSYRYNVTGSINRLGYRGSAHAVERTDSTTRIALIGDSFTIGYGVRDEHISSMIMEQMLNKSEKGKFEVLNFGITGTATPQQADYLERFVRRFKPDITMVIMHLNDVTLVAENGFIGAMTKNREFYWNIRKKSFLLNLITAELSRWKLHQQIYDLYQTSFQKDSVEWLRVQQALIKIRNICSQDGSQMRLVIHPILYNLSDRYPFQLAHSAIKEFADKNGIEAFDLLDALYGQEADKLWVHIADQHPNEKAHAIVGKALANYTRGSLNQTVLN